MRTRASGREGVCGLIGLAFSQDPRPLFGTSTRWSSSHVYSHGKKNLGGRARPTLLFHKDPVLIHTSPRTLTMVVCTSRMRGTSTPRRNPAPPSSLLLPAAAQVTVTCGPMRLQRGCQGESQRMAQRLWPEDLRVQHGTPDSSPSEGVECIAVTRSSRHELEDELLHL